MSYCPMCGAHGGATVVAGCDDCHRREACIAPGDSCAYPDNEYPDCKGCPYYYLTPKSERIIS